MCEKIANSKIRKMYLEGRWRKTKLSACSQGGFQEHCHFVKDLVDGEEGQYYNKIKKCDGDQ